MQHNNNNYGKSKLKYNHLGGVILLYNKIFDIILGCQVFPVNFEFGAGLKNAVYK